MSRPSETQCESPESPSDSPETVNLSALYQVVTPKFVAGFTTDATGTIRQSTPILARRCVGVPVSKLRLPKGWIVVKVSDL